jgi:GDPmannose 4,6-dehydratase
MAARRALITGITGQDGSYLAELLLQKGYEVHGIVRRVALEDPEHRLSRIHPVRSRLKLHAASLESYASVHQAVAKVQPDECYHLAAQSFVSYSFDDEFSTLNTNINGTHYLLSAVKNLALNAASISPDRARCSEKPTRRSQNERTGSIPCSMPYGISKVAGFDHLKLSRSLPDARIERYPVQSRIPRARFEFVTRKITPAPRAFWPAIGDAAARESEAKRDWGHAREYVEAMWLMLQQPELDDYVISTGEHISGPRIRRLAFRSVGLDYRQYVVSDPDLFRPAEVNLLLGDSAKARAKLGWKNRVRFEALVREMVEEDCRALGVGEFQRATQGTD